MSETTSPAWASMAATPVPSGVHLRLPAGADRDDGGGDRPGHQEEAGGEDYAPATQ